VDWTRKRKKKLKGGIRKSQNVIFYHHVAAPFRNQSAQKFGYFVHLSDEIMPAKFGSKIFIGFYRLRGGKKHYSFRKKANGLHISAARYRAGL